MVSPLFPSVFGFPSQPVGNPNTMPVSPLAATNPAAISNNLISPSALASTTSPNTLALGNPAALMNSLLGININTGPNPFTGGLGGIPGINLGGPTTTDSQQLQTSLAKIQQDPEGAQLLQIALAKGYQIQVGDPSAFSGFLDKGVTGAARDNCPTCQQAAAAAIGDGVTVQGITLTNGPNGNQIIISPQTNDFDKTLVHELYHAATDDDGTSKTEEATANIIGDRVSARINGRPARDPQQIIAETFPLYPELPDTN